MLRSTKSRVHPILKSNVNMVYSRFYYGIVSKYTTLFRYQKHG